MVSIQLCLLLLLLSFSVVLSLLEMCMGLMFFNVIINVKGRQSTQRSFNKRIC